MRNCTKILYIAGMGRSGSTVLDSVLGGHQKVIGLGEVTNAYNAWNSPVEYCACGELARRCHFWREVRRNWERHLPGSVSPERWHVLQRRFERIRYFPLAYLTKGMRGRDYGGYLEGLQCLYESITRVTGISTMVDSSKNPVRALHLARAPRVDLRVIHLLRDGRGVAASLKKSYEADPKRGIQRPIQGKPVWRTAVTWLLLNGLVERAISKLPPDRSMRVRHEDLLAEPSGTLARIGNLADIDYSEVARGMEQGRSIKVGHAIAGNRVRMHGAIRLRPDSGWKQRLTQRDLQIFHLLAGYRSSRYGYPRRI